MRKRVRAEGTRPNAATKRALVTSWSRATLKGRLKSIAAFQTAFGHDEAASNGIAPLPYSNSAKPRKIRPKLLNKHPIQKSNAAGLLF